LRGFASGSSTCKIPLVFRALVVEGDPIIRFSIVNELWYSGFEILEAADPREAICIASQSPAPVDVLVTDLQMPGTDECQLGPTLRRSNPHIRVLIVSTYRPKDFPNDCDHDGFLEKPVTPQAVASAAKELIHSGFASG
jgi:CheY-like chemotaxis protein